MKHWIAVCGTAALGNWGSAIQSSMDEVRSLLSSREDSMPRVSLTYVERVVGASHNVLESREGDLEFDRVQRCVRYNTRNAKGKDIEIRATWNGARGERRETLLEPDPATGAMRPGRTAIGKFSVPPPEVQDAGCPINFAWTFVGQPWRNALAAQHKPVLLGREVVNGRDCAVVLLDENMQVEGNGAYGRPWVVYVDDKRTCLAIRLVSYLTPEESKFMWARTSSTASTASSADDVGSLLHRTISDRTWIEDRRWDVLSVSEISPGVYCPESMVTSTPNFPQFPTYEIAITKAEVGAASAPIAESAPYPPGAQVYDATSGRYYEQDSESVPVTEDDLTFWQALDAAKRRHGSSASLHTLSHEPLGVASCGPAALYFVGRIYDDGIRLQQIIDCVPAEERRAGRTSMHTLEDAASALGLAAAVVHTDEAGLRALNRPVVAHLKGGARGSVEHFVVAEPGEKSITVTSPPHAASDVEYGEFLSLWCVAKTLH